MEVKIYTTPTCGYCHQAKRYFGEKGIGYTEFDVSRDRGAADEMVRLTGHMGVPVIVVDGQVIVGFDRPRLEQLLGAGRQPQRPRFGLKVADASSVAQKLGAVPVFGALVGDVAPSSLGERAGLRRGDVITEVNLRPVRGAEDVERAFQELAPGGRAIIVLLRGEETLKVEVEV